MSELKSMNEITLSRPAKIILKHKYKPRHPIYWLSYKFLNNTRMIIGEMELYDYDLINSDDDVILRGGQMAEILFELDYERLFTRLIAVLALLVSIATLFVTCIALMRH